MAQYWPTTAAITGDPVVAAKMNSLPKYVFLRTLDKAAWENSTLVKENAAAQVRKLKEEPGKSLFLFGSADLAAALTRDGLIDEFRIMVSPVVLGSGKPLFKDVQGRLDLKLLRATTFDSGNVLLYYEK
jgi:dihydrofolate reductase